MKCSLKNQGYTMVELVMVIVIIGILTGIILPVFLHGGLDEGTDTLKSSILCAKSFATTKRVQCTLTMNANYYNPPNPSPCTITIEYKSTGTDTAQNVKRLYQLPEYIQFYQYQVVGTGTENFISGTKTTKTIYFEPLGIANSTQNSATPQDIVITLKDIKTGSTTSRTIIGNTCQIKR